MPCSPQSCHGCSCAPQNGHVNIEDCETELLALRKRTRELEQTLASMHPGPSPKSRRLRSAQWFNNIADPGMSALYIERYLNYGVTRDELMSGKPVVGIAQSGSDLAPCNRHHLELVKRVREGIRTAGGVAFEFPTHPIQETSRRPTACLDRNLAYLGLVEVLHGYPLDGVVLLTGCDKTTPALLMAAATMVCLTQHCVYVLLTPEGYPCYLYERWSHAERLYGEQAGRLGNGRLGGQGTACCGKN